MTKAVRLQPQPRAMNFGTAGAPVDKQRLSVVAMHPSHFDSALIAQWMVALKQVSESKPERPAKVRIVTSIMKSLANGIGKNDRLLDCSYQP